MSQDIFLQINGVEGELHDSAYQDEIKVLSFGWKPFQDFTMHEISGNGVVTAGNDIKGNKES